MLVTDNDRNCYLKNAYDSLKENAPMLFFRESYRRDEEYHGTVDSVEEWEQITGEDYKTSQSRKVRNSEDGTVIEVLVPLLPARAKDKNGYIEEFENVGFDVEKFIEMDVFDNAPHSASIYVRK